MNEVLGLLDDVEVVGELGRGAETAVYRIRRAGVDYALKVLSGPGRTDEAVAVGFRREAALLARVDHPGVPRVYDVGSTGDRPYLVLEFVEGQSLARRLAAGPLAEDEIVRLDGDLSDALAAAHRAGVVHRDIKPANIIVTPSGRARLIDFGLAVTRTDGEAVVGTFDYSAPEQTGMLARAVDGRADLYALGVVMFECATGRLPFVADDVGQLIALHAAAPPPDPRSLRPELSDELAERILALLAKDPDDRPRVADHTRARLVGRQPEQAALLDRWRRALAGNGGVALVEGSPGSGKSMLAAHLADEAREAGALVLAGKCDGDSPLPLAPLRTAVDGYLRTVTALPPQEREAAVDMLRAAAGVGAGLLSPLSPALALLLDAPRLAADERHEQFVSAVASFLAALATRHGGLLLVVDDVQWLDPTSLAVLRSLTEELAGVPLLVLATARDDDPPSVERFTDATGALLAPRLPIGRLPEASVAELVCGYLAGSAVSDEVLAELATLGQGNPFTTIEFLRALVDTGALRPSWGVWQLDAARLRSVELPTDVFELVLARVGGLGEHVLEILTLAAAIGSRFDAGLLAEVGGRDPEAALAEGRRHGVLHENAFVHDRIRESLLSAVSAADRRRLHQRIAVVLDSRTVSDPASVYAVAGHYAQGERDLTPDRLVATAWAAGELALEENAPSAAVTFLETAAGVGADLGSRFEEALAVAYLATGQAEAACERLEPALAREDDPLRRAALRLQLAIATRIRWKLSVSLEHVREGLAELGRPLPRHPARLGLLTLRLMVRWLVGGAPGPRRHPITGAAAERLRLEILLSQAGGAVAGIGLQPALSVILTLRPALRAHRLGSCPEYALAYSETSVVAGFARMPRRRDRIFRRCEALTARLGDPKLTARLTWEHEFARAANGSSWAAMARLIEAERRWLEADYYSNMAFLRAQELVVRGYAREALDWYDRGRARLSSVEAITVYDLTAAMAHSLLGGVPETPAIPAGEAPTGPDNGYWVHHLNAAVRVAVEQDGPITIVDDAMACFDRFGIPIGPLLGIQRAIFVYEAFARITQARRDPSESHAAAAAAAVRRVGKVAGDELLNAYHQILEANLEQLDDRPDRALTRLAKAERILVRLDAPLAHYEAARVRAWALRATGEPALARQQADYALMLADRHGWARRARWITAEWDNRVAQGTVRRSEKHSAGTDRYRRRLTALQQVNAAAASVIDPQRLARIALDETLRIFAAERAVLFLTDGDDRPRLSVARGSEGDLTELTGYSASLVDKVAAERRPIVITGGEEGAALGSRSTVVHGLRSIMIAPLELDGRLLGVVYLDSRVAKGVFTDEDVDVLTAVTSQVAVSLETARAAQLEVAVHAARRQRDTAEALRVAMLELTATLEPDQVLDLLRDLVGRTVDADRVHIAWGDGVTEPRLGTGADAPAVLGPVRTWLSVPLHTRGGERGTLLAGATGGGEFGAAQLDLVAALAGQGATAYENARLFAQVRELATVDALTGVLNRRHFGELAGLQLATARRNHRPLAGMMFDIDHFKRINDTYGHSAGDEVIRGVADTLRSIVREPDVVCRYGGEEFAVVMSEMQGDPLAVADRVRARVADLTFPGGIAVTVSAGVAELKPDDDLAALLRRADEALYRAKESGRNTVRAG